MGELYGQHYHGDTNVKTVYNNNKKVPFFHFFVFVFVFLLLLFFLYCLGHWCVTFNSASE